MSEKASFSIRDTNIQKGIAMLMVLGIHLFVRSDTSLYDYQWEIHGLPVLNYIFYQLKIGVTIFMILSGYGLNESYKKNCRTYGENRACMIAFIRSRFSKLYTNYWVVFILFAGVGLSMGWISISKTWGGVSGLVIDFFGIRDITYDFWPSKTLNPTWWYLSAVVCCYLSFPLLKKMISRNAYGLIFFLGGGYS